MIELNGAVEFEPGYALPGQDVYEAIAVALRLDGSPADELTLPLQTAVAEIRTRSRAHDSLLAHQRARNVGSDESPQP